MKMRIKVTVASPIASPSHFHVYDLANNQAADEGHHSGQYHQLLSDLACPQDADGVGIEEIKRDSQRERQERQYPAGQSALRRMYADLPLEFKALANDVRGLFQDFGEVASAFFLDQDGSGHDSEVLQRNAGEEVFKRDPQFEAIVLLLEAYAELVADGIRGLLGHKADGGVEAVSGAQAAHH